MFTLFYTYWEFLLISSNVYDSCESLNLYYSENFGTNI